jgi:tRNA-specific adenosine deaminase 1
MYCTCAPCGDASMELCMAAQEDPTPWVVTPKQENTFSQDGDSQKIQTQTLLDGRAHFSILGVVRRKPARADAESTLSKSCSDKLALRQVTSLLSYPASLLVAPTESAYLAGVILPEEEISRVACDRAFGAGPTGRMRKLRDRQWQREKRPDEAKYGYRFRPFDVLPVPTETVEALWPYGKRKSEGISAPSTSTTPTKGGKKNSNKPSNISAVWIAAPSSSPSPSPQVSLSQTQNGSEKTGVIETIVNGVKQGNRAASVTARGASVLSRAKMWNLLREIVASIPSPSSSLSSPSGDNLGHNIVANDERDASAMNTTPVNAKDRWRTVIEAPSYEKFKRPPSSPEDGCCCLQLLLRNSAMQDAKRVLQPWIPNRGDEGWNVVDVLADSKHMNRR